MGAAPQAAATLMSIVLLGGCALPNAVLVPARERPFDFQRDTFAFPNQVEYTYRIDVASNSTVAIGRDPDAKYIQRCFAMSKATRQFLQFAHFDPGLPQVSDEEYRERVRQVLDHDPMERRPRERIVIPGFGSLRAFSARHEAMVKDEVGGSWLKSYFQRGHWRLIYPFSDSHQEDTADVLLAELRVNRPPVVHLITFPELGINHAVMLIDARETADGIEFDVYDPNDNLRPTSLTYDRRRKEFSFPRQFYFAGGPVDVYQIYRSLLY